MIVKFAEEHYIPLEWVLNKIEAADDLELSEIIQALIVRYDKIHPDWDINFLSLPKEPVQRKEYIKNLIEFLQHHTKSQTES